MDCSKTKLDFPARYVLIAWGTLGILIAHTLRVNLSVAIVAMVSSPTDATEGNTSSVSACPELLSKHNVSHLSLKHSGEFDWDIKTQSMLHGAFFYGAVAAPLPGGFLANQWNGKWVVGLGMLLGSIVTILSPITARFNVNAFIVLRVILGFSFGVQFPAFYAMIGRWIPKLERSRVTASLTSGMFIGNIIGFILSGFLSKSSFLGGWPSAFYVFGAIGCVWFIFWTFLIYDRPEEHPRITEAELFCIAENTTHGKAPNIPWIPILMSVRLWAITVAYFGQGWGLFTLMTLMPTYLSSVLHFSITENGVLCAVPYVLLVIFSFATSYLADKLRQKEKLSTTAIRKIFNSVGFFGSGLFILLVAFIGCRPAMSIIFLCLSLGFTGANASGYMVTHIDMSPQLSGITWGIVATIGGSCGILAPYTVGQITATGDALHNWSIVFGITAGVTFATGIFYDIFASAELQSWNTPIKELTQQATTDLQNYSEDKKSSKTDQTKL